LSLFSFKNTFRFAIGFSNIPMSSKQEVVHNGIVKSLSYNSINVGIVVKAGCGSCQIKNSCSMVEKSDKELEIECDPTQFRVGQQVSVRLKTQQGMNAIFLGYVLPFLILFSTMLISSTISNNEGTTGLLSLASVAVYYIVLYFFKNRIKKKFTYVVIPQNNTI
jgi:sigma-E factor negative regulatory protein RseC